MILKGILELLISLYASMFSGITDFFDMLQAPSFYFGWLSDVLPVFACIRYIIPLVQLIPLFVAIIAILVIRIVIALLHVIFGKLIPIW